MGFTGRIGFTGLTSFIGLTVGTFGTLETPLGFFRNFQGI
jgi:hypothetical protein